MPYDLYPAVDEDYDFPPEVRAALARSLDLRSMVPPMTTVERNNLTGENLWDGRLIYNTTIGRINRYDLATTTWYAIADYSEVASVATDLSNKTGFRNYMRNGDMSIAQRGDGPYAGGGAYGIDGWVNGAAGGTVSFVRIAAALGTAMGVDGARYAYRANIASQAAAGDYVYFGHKIEGVRTLAGKEVTLSFRAMAASGTPKIGIEVYQAFGTGGAPSADVITAIGAVTISNVATRYSITFTIPSIAGKALGTLNNDTLGINFWLSAGTNSAARASNIGIQNVNFDVTDIQLEASNKTSPFERLPQQLQMAWCLRYYRRLTGGQTSGLFGYGSSMSSTGSRYLVAFPNPMAKVPSLGWSGASTMIPYDLASGGYASGIGIQAADTQQMLFDVSSSGGLTAGRACYLIPNLNAYLEFIAEL